MSGGGEAGLIIGLVTSLTGAAATIYLVKQLKQSTKAPEGQ
jgi:hypothetical protein